MSFIKNFAVAVGVTLASNGAFAGEAEVNAAVCMSRKDDADNFKLPEGQEKETCSCVGKNSAWMKRSYPQLSSTDLIQKGYHACLSPSAISSYYSNLAYRTVVGQVGSATAQNYASCMKTQGLIEGMRFSNDSRTFNEAYDAAGKKCQYIVNVNGLTRSLQ